MARGCCLNQCWYINNWTFENKIQCNSNQNTKPFIDENRFFKMMAENKSSACISLVLLPGATIATTYLGFYSKFNNFQGTIRLYTLVCMPVIVKAIWIFHTPHHRSSCWFHFDVRTSGTHQWCLEGDLVEIKPWVRNEIPLRFHIDNREACMRISASMSL